MEISELYEKIVGKCSFYDITFISVTLSSSISQYTNTSQDSPFYHFRGRISKTMQVFSMGNTNPEELIENIVKEADRKIKKKELQLYRENLKLKK